MNKSQATISEFKENPKNNKILGQVNEARIKIHLKNIKAKTFYRKVRCRQGLCKIRIQAVANIPNPYSENRQISIWPSQNSDMK